MENACAVRFSLSSSSSSSSEEETDSAGLSLRPSVRVTLEASSYSQRQRGEVY
jgi:hypothetical protein